MPMPMAATTVCAEVVTTLTLPMLTATMVTEEGMMTATALPTAGALAVSTMRVVLNLVMSTGCLVASMGTLLTMTPITWAAPMLMPGTMLVTVVAMGVMTMPMIGEVTLLWLMTVAW